MRELGHRIVIITACTEKLYTEPYKTTIEGLQKGGIVYDKLICTLEKAEACVAEHIDILIDDSIQNCYKQMTRVGQYTIENPNSQSVILDPYNQQMQKLSGQKDWMDFIT